MSNDPLSDVLQLTAARSVITGGFSAGGTWALRFAAPNEIKFAVIVKGSCWFCLDGGKPIRVNEGDVGLLSGTRGYVISSSVKAKPVDAMRALAVKRPSGLARIGTGSDCVVIAGGVSLDPAQAAILTDVLPPLIHVKSGAASPARWLIEQLLADRASTSAGTTIATALHAQLLFVQILRSYLESSGPLPSGWLRAIRDERIARALQLMHREPARAWRLGELAKAAAMSRTSFAVEFKAVAGIAPLAYLATWRMRLAQQKLREETAAVSEIAATLGYTSESAFSHAFKRVTGSSPRDYRSSERSRQ